MKIRGPWVRWRRAAEDARQDAESARAELHAAQERRQVANSQAFVSSAVTARLRREIERNGWTELLQHAWGGR